MLSDLTGSEAIAASRSRDTTVTEIAKAGLQRIATREPVVQAFAHHRPALVMQGARDLERGDPALPLLGMTVAIKDLIDTVDYPTELGSRIHRGRRPEQDAAVVRRPPTPGR